MGQGSDEGPAILRRGRSGVAQLVERVAVNHRPLWVRAPPPELSGRPRVGKQPEIGRTDQPDPEGVFDQAVATVGGQRTGIAP